MPFKSFADAIHPLAITKDILNSPDDFYGWPLRRLFEEYTDRSPYVRPGIVVHNAREPIRRATLGDIAAISDVRLNRNCTRRDDPTGGKVKWGEVERVDVASWLVGCESLLQYFQQDCQELNFFNGVKSFFPTSNNLWNGNRNGKSDTINAWNTRLSKARDKEIRQLMLQFLLTILLCTMAFSGIPIKKRPLLNNEPKKPGIQVELFFEDRGYVDEPKATRAIAAFFEIAYTRYLPRLENWLKTPQEVRNETIPTRGTLRKLLEESAVGKDEKDEVIRLLLDDKKSERQTFVIMHLTRPLNDLLCNPLYENENSASYKNPKPYTYTRHDGGCADQVFKACLCHELFLQIQEALNLQTIMGQKQP